MKICIVGGVAGGASAATRLRRLNENAEIVLFEKGEYISYANCGLPYYIGGVIKEKENLIVTKPELLRNRFDVDVRINSEVLAIHPKDKKIVVKNHITGEEYEESYDKLILSPGAAAKKPSFPGVNEEGIFTLRTVPDTFKIDEYIKERNPKSAVVIGGGFIGIEMAENLKEKGLDVTVVEYSNQVVASLDVEMANILHQHLIENGIKLRLNTGVTSFKKQEDGSLELETTQQKTLHCEMAILSMGVSPESRLAKDAGLTLGLGGSISVNDSYQTSDPDIYAVGDAISIINLVSGKEGLIPLAGPANKQGRIAAENALGAQKTIGMGVQGSAVLKVFELTAASTGMNEKQLKKEGMEYKKTYVHPQSHASYYPGATPISMKLLFDKDGKILGAQAVGYEGVEKRIDVIATAMRFSGTVYDLENLELCYAPPFSSAKDPVNMLGFTAANILKGDMPVWYAEELETMDLNSVTFLDIGTPEEIMMGTLPNAVNLNLDSLRQHLDEIDKSKPVYVTCRVGLRGYIATRMLRQNGFDAKNLSGGYRTYSHVTYKINEEEPLLIEKSDFEPAQQDVTEQQKTAQTTKTIEVDACGLQCPGPIMKVSSAMKEMKDGEHLIIRASDPAFASDIKVWCERTGNHLEGIKNQKGIYEVKLQKMEGSVPGACSNDLTQPIGGNDKTMVVFSGDLDKAIAAFIIANGAVAMDRKVTLFFTFWGLNILRKHQAVKVNKSLVEGMFGKMMPRGSQKLGLSRMNMSGMGAKMIRRVMKSKNVSSLEELIQTAIDNGVRIVACQMSMDVMGIRAEELIDGVEIGGVATFLGAAETSDTNLFI